MPAANTITISATSPAIATSSVGSAASVVGPNGAALSGDYLSGYYSMAVTANLQGATGGTLDVYLQVSYDSGATWVDYAHWTQLAGSAGAVSYISTHTRAKSQALATAPSHSLTANSTADGEWGTQARLFFTAGAGTSAGAVQTVVIHVEGVHTA